MVTHDPYAASFCQRIIFIKDGELVHEIHQQGNRESFYNEIMDNLREIEGGGHEL